MRDALEEVGLGHLKDRLSAEEPWDQTLSGGEKQRLAFARLLIHRPDLIVMDEATSALDPASQEKLLHLIDEKLPNATLISVGHRPELEEYHERKLVLEHRPGGARLVGDEVITFRPGRGVALVRRLFRWRGRRGDKPEETVETLVGPADGHSTVADAIAKTAPKPRAEQPEREPAEKV